MVFYNSKELATYMVTKVKDGRQWGKLRYFTHTEIYRKYYKRWENTYIPKCIEELTTYIEQADIQFPCEYHSEITYADGYCTYFKVTFEPYNQITFKELLDK